MQVDKSISINNTPYELSYTEQKTNNKLPELNNQAKLSEPEIITDEVIKTLLNLSADIITVLNEDGTILYESDSISSILGYEKEELIGKNAFTYVHKDDVTRVYNDFQKGITNKGKTIISSFRFRRSNGEYVYLESSGAKYGDKTNDKLVIISRDITSRINTEKNLNRLSTAVEQSSSIVVITDIDGKIEYVNKKFSELTGYCREEAVGGKTSILKSEETNDDVYRDLWTTILTGKVWQGVLKNRKKCGEYYWERIKISPVVDENDRITNFIALKDDITKEKKINEKLSQSLKEKELMLKEIHHRVKNNLQIVISLLNLQSASVDDVKLKNQLTISQNRVRSMALIHQHLYRSGDLSRIDMDEYILSLSSQLLSAFADHKDSMKITVDAKDIFFSIETAVPFGLLINELITNSLKHGFPGGKNGKIHIKLILLEDYHYELYYCDSGIGMPFNIVNGHVVGFGMQLIDMLVSQLEGKIEHVPSKGTKYKIYFRGNNYQTRFQLS